MRAAVWLLASTAFTIAAVPGACNQCPKGSAWKQIWVAGVPKECELVITRAGGVVSYLAPCGEPEFRMLAVCAVTTPEQLAPAPPR